jgi:hypothetical protein
MGTMVLTELVSLSGRNILLRIRLGIGEQAVPSVSLWLLIHELPRAPSYAA